MLSRRHAACPCAARSRSPRCFDRFGPGQRRDHHQEVQTSWRLLDYIGVDYREAVAGGKVINQLEYAEMVEFSSSVSAKLAVLPVKPERAKLSRMRGRWSRLSTPRPSPATIAGAPRRWPPSYSQPIRCPSLPHLHRTSPAALSSTPRVAHRATAGKAKARRRSSPSSTRRPSPSPTVSGRASAASSASIRSITQGLEGTAMQSFAALPEEDRWALAFHAGTLAYRRRRSRRADLARGSCGPRPGSRPRCFGRPHACRAGSAGSGPTRRRR